MKFSKHNNPNRRRSRRTQTHSASYIAERREEMWREIGRAVNAGADPNGAEVEAIVRAYDITLNPIR